MNAKISTPIVGGAKVSAAVEIQTMRSRALLQFESTNLCSMNLHTLTAIQSVVGHGDEFGRWQTPKRWFTTGTKARLDVNLRNRIIASLPNDSLRSKAIESKYAPLLNQAVKLANCYLIALRIGPSSLGRRPLSESLGASHISQIAYQVIPLICALALARWFDTDSWDDADTKFLSQLRQEDLEPLSNSQRSSVLTECKRMQFLHDHFWWHDLPLMDLSTEGTTAVAGKKQENEPERKRDSHLPLPDDYVSEMGLRSIWLIESIGPNVIALTAGINQIWEDTKNFGDALEVQEWRRRAVENLLMDWEWRDENGVPINQPPFAIRLSQHGKKAGKKSEADHQWPPTSLAEVLGLCSNVQQAHLFVVSMSTGGRVSETLDLRRNCVEYARNGIPYASGRTFKLVRMQEGEIRDWVLPDLAVKAIEQQVRLVGLIERLSRQNPASDARAKHRELTDHLWAQISSASGSDRTQPFVNLGTAMVAYATAIGMETHPGGQSFRPHRFRKTVARLVALALTQAPKILMDVFGHKSIEMTLHYILTDKSLQAEIERISRELRVMRAVVAVEAIVAAEDSAETDSDLGSYGGPAALMIGRAVKAQRGRAHQRGEQWGAGNVRELAEILTLQGKAWEVVREGVVCTKLPGTESGPCNKSKGRPEPSHCQTNCNHRLEEAFLREDVDASIASSVREFETAFQEEDELMQAMWAGQIRAHLPRFSDLKEKWQTNPTVQRVLIASNEEPTEAAA